MTIADIPPRTRAKIKKSSSRKGVETAALPPPQPGPQTEFLSTEADICLYGGSAGSGKTLGLLLDFAQPQFLSNPGYKAVIFRRTYPEVRNEGGLWDESASLYPAIAGTPNTTYLRWQFPTGSTIRFAHLQHEKDVYSWQGGQVTRVGFDEVTHFTKYQFFYILSRMRTMTGIKPQIRATCNPDAESWLAEFIDWWIDSQGFPYPDRSGVLRYFIRKGEDIFWADSEEELCDRFPGCRPKSFTFIAAKITDNPILLEKDPDYLANLEAQHPVDVARLLHGNWRVKPESGKVFNRSWFKVVDELPAGIQLLRFWDMAATPEELNKNAFYTAGLLLGYHKGVYYVAHLIAEQLGPTEGDDLIINTASQDGRKVILRWELEGGSSGKKVDAYLRSRLLGFNALGVKPDTNKLARSKPAATEAARDNIKILRGSWNNTFLDSVHAFDGTRKPLITDVVDALSGAFNELSERVRSHRPTATLPPSVPGPNSPANLRKIMK